MGTNYRWIGSCATDIVRDIGPPQVNDQAMNVRIFAQMQIIRSTAPEIAERCDKISDLARKRFGPGRVPEDAAIHQANLRAQLESLIRWTEKKRGIAPSASRKSP